MVASLRSLVLRQGPRYLHLLTRERGKLSVYPGGRRFPPGAEGTFLLLPPHRRGGMWRFKSATLHFRPPPTWSWVQEVGGVLRLLDHALANEQPDLHLYDMLSTWVQDLSEARPPLGVFLLDLLDSLGKPLPAPSCVQCGQQTPPLHLHPDGWRCPRCSPPPPDLPAMEHPGTWPADPSPENLFLWARAWIRWHFHLDPWATQSR